ncbi:MAG: hypothetical protein HY654_06625 [Acidobacteria bacterium]|nr:hypothetical protein [Acidobacteriota bacterium]
MMVVKLKTVRDRGGDMKLLHLTSRNQRLLALMKLMTVFEVLTNSNPEPESHGHDPVGAV